MINPKSKIDGINKLLKNKGLVFFYQGNRLDPHMTFEHYNIKNGDEIMIQLQDEKKKIVRHKSKSDQKLNYLIVNDYKLLISNFINYKKFKKLPLIPYNCLCRVGIIEVNIIIPEGLSFDLN